MSDLPLLGDLHLSDYLSALASDSLFPSAGAAAALTGAQAAALFAMVCRVNLRKLREATEGKRSATPGAEQPAYWEQVLEQAVSRTRRLLDLAQEDGAAYREVVAEAPRGPSHAIEVPLGIARCGEELVGLIEDALPKSYPPVRADAETALWLARGSKKAALTVARYNLPLLRSNGERDFYRKQIEQLSGKGD